MSATATVARKRTSLWLDTVRGERLPRLDRPLSVDVAVLGGGIVGVSTALLLKRAGMTVAVVEASRVGTGVTGHTTAKLSSLHGLSYARIASSFGDDGARAYGEANQAGIEQIAQWVEEEGIDCDFRRKPNFTYATSRERVVDIEREVEAAQRAGLPASYTEETDLPYPVAGAIRFDVTGRVPSAPLPARARGARRGRRQPRVRADARDGGVRGAPCRVETTGPPLTAGHVVVATHFPFLDRGLYFARIHPERSYALGVRVRGQAPQGMYISAEQPTRSIRSHPVADGEILIVGGEGHKTGQGGDTLERYRALERFAREHWDVESVEYQWASQDNESVDHLPYIGRLSPHSRRLYTATGFKKWGLAQGVAAGMILEDLIIGRDEPVGGPLRPGRMKPLASAQGLGEGERERRAALHRRPGDEARRARCGRARAGRGATSSRLDGEQGRRLPRRRRDAARRLARLHPPGLPAELELRRPQLGLPVPRLALLPGRGDPARAGRQTAGAEDLSETRWSAPNSGTGSHISRRRDEVRAPTWSPSRSGLSTSAVRTTDRRSS